MVCQKCNESSKKVILSSVLIVLLLILSTVIVVNVILKNNTNKNDSIPTENINNNLLMTIEDVFNIDEQGTVITGTIEKGKIKVNDEIQILGLGKNVITTVVGLEFLRNKLDSAKAGDSVSIFLPKHIKYEDILIGQAVITPNTMKSYKRFKTKIEITDAETIGGKELVLNSKTKLYYDFKAKNYNGEMTYMTNNVTLKKGDVFETDIILETDIVISVGTKFKIIKEGKYSKEKIGEGIVTKVYEE